MAQNRLLLIQKPESPYKTEVQAAAPRISGVMCSPRMGPGDESKNISNSRLVLWDLSGFTLEEIKSFAHLLSVVGSPIVVVGDRLDAAVREILGKVWVLGLVENPREADEVAAALGVAQATWERIEKLSGDLQSLKVEVAQRKVIEDAKRALTASKKISEQEAMRRLQKKARSTNQKLHQVAQAVLHGREIFDEENGF